MYLLPQSTTVVILRAPMETPEGLVVGLFKVVLDSSEGQKKTSDLQVLKAAKYGYHNEGLKSGHSCLKKSSSNPIYPALKTSPDPPSEGTHGAWGFCSRSSTSRVSTKRVHRIT